MVQNGCELVPLPVSEQLDAPLLTNSVEATAEATVVCAITSRTTAITAMPLANEAAVAERPAAAGAAFSRRVTGLPRASSQVPPSTPPRPVLTERASAAAGSDYTTSGNRGLEETGRGRSARPAPVPRRASLS